MGNHSVTPPSSPDDDAFMRRALALARQASDSGEVPVGALVTFDGRVVSEAHNLREMLEDPTAHAEILALRLAARSLRTWRLDRCTLYATLEPCAMCAGAIVQSRLGRLVYGASDLKAGACHSLYRLTSDPRLNHRPKLTRDLLAEESRQILTDFFRARRPIRDPRRGA